MDKASESKKGQEDKENDNSENKKEEKIEEEKPQVEQQKEEETEDIETKEETEDKKETKEETPDQAKEQASKPEQKKEKKAKAKKTTKDDKKETDDFQYIVRIANTDVDGNKRLVHGLTSIKGLGMHLASIVADKTGINKNTKIGNLSEAQVKKIQSVLDNIDENVPGWMVNHRKDMETGKDVHLIGPEIDLRLRDEINIMRKIRSYRGIRHESGLRVRGQRTRTNNRTGLTLGVSKKQHQSK